LRPWNMKGEKDQKAMEVMQEGEDIAYEKRDAIGHEDRMALNALRDRFYGAMEAHDFDEALEAARKFKAKAQEVGLGGGEMTAKQKLQNLIGYTEYVLHRYDWMMDAELTFELNRIKEEGKEALSSGETAQIEAKYKELDNATDKIPNEVQAMVGISMAIAQKVRPLDVAVAANLEEKLQEAEKLIKDQNPKGLSLLQQVAEELTKFIEEHPEPGEQLIPCPYPGCPHQVRPGTYFCPDGHPVPVPKGSSGLSSDL